MARQAEAERERRAKVIAATGELEASHELAEAAATLASRPDRYSCVRCRPSPRSPPSTTRRSSSRSRSSCSSSCAARGGIAAGDGGRSSGAEPPPKPTPEPLGVYAVPPPRPLAPVAGGAGKEGEDGEGGDPPAVGETEGG